LKATDTHSLIAWVAAAILLAVLGSSCMAQVPRSGGPGSTPGRREQQAGSSIEEKEVLAVLNELRTDPSSQIPVLEKYLTLFDGDKLRFPGEIPLLTKEGQSAVEEAIRFLKKQSSLPAFELSKGMSMAAADHLRDIGTKGKYGHYGTDGSTPSDRLKRYGTPRVGAAENLGFGEKTGRRMVIMLLIDDGVPGRGHRKTMFNPKYKVTGIACGPHAEFGQMCVIDFAGGYDEKDP
jgi:uncharacterized protein YkwD